MPYQWYHHMHIYHSKPSHGSCLSIQASILKTSDKIREGFSFQANLRSDNVVSHLKCIGHVVNWSIILTSTSRVTGSMSIPLLWRRLGRALRNSLMSTITRGAACDDFALTKSHDMEATYLYFLHSSPSPAVGRGNRRVACFASFSLLSSLPVLWHNHGGLLLDQTFKSFLLSPQGGQVRLLLHTTSIWMWW